MEKAFSSVKIRKSSIIKEVDIFSAASVIVSEAVMTRWQNSIDLVAKVLQIPAVLIMRLHEKEIEVFLSSRSPGNPYRQSARDHLLQGFYCETVIGTGTGLAVEDALEDPDWKDNPDVELEMISYLGFPLKWPGGEIFGTICLLDSKPTQFSPEAEDMLIALQHSFETDLKLLLAQYDLSKSEQKFRLLNEEKDRFFSILAHDLRVPFTTLIGLSEILMESIGDSEKETRLDMAQAVYKSATGVFDLLENLLDWARLQRGNIVFEPVVVDVSVLARQVLGHLDLSITSKRLKFFDGAGNGIRFKADPYMLSVVIRNLLTNAIKFTERGGSIELRCAVNEDRLTLEVKDTGTGMAPDVIRKLFSPDSRGTRGTEGEPSSGLGLIVVKEFVERHGGTISVESEFGKGSTFTVKLPSGN